MSEEAEPMTLEKRLEYLSGAMAMVCVVLGRISQTFGDFQGAALMVSGYVDSLKAIYGEKEGEDARASIIESVTGIPLSEVRSLKEKGMSTEQIVEIFKWRVGDVGN